MSLIDKAYFTLEELEERWQLPHRDLAYLAENGLLRLSVRLFGVQMEFGVYEEGADGEWFTVPKNAAASPGSRTCRSAMCSGVFRQGQVDVVHFHAPEKEYCYLIEPTRTVSVCRDDLLVRREERDRVESQHALVRKGSVAPSLQQANDYREVRTAGLSVQSRTRAGARREAAARGRDLVESLVRGQARSWAKPDPPVRAWPMSSSHSRIGAA